VDKSEVVFTYLGRCSGQLLGPQKGRLLCAHRSQTRWISRNFYTPLCYTYL